MAIAAVHASSAATTANQYNITWSDSDFFTPTYLQVNATDRVTFLFMDTTTPHLVVQGTWCTPAPNPAFQPFTGNQTVIFTQPGVYEYYDATDGLCKQGARGRIQVLQPGSSGSGNTTNQGDTSNGWYNAYFGNAGCSLGGGSGSGSGGSSSGGSGPGGIGSGGSGSGGTGPGGVGSGGSGGSGTGAGGSGSGGSGGAGTGGAGGIGSGGSANGGSGTGGIGGNGTTLPTNNETNTTLPTNNTNKTNGTASSLRDSTAGKTVATVLLAVVVNQVMA